MKDSREKLLKSIYEHNQTFGYAYQIEFEEDDISEETSRLQNDVEYLISRDYVKEEANLSSGYFLIITEKGERFVENGFKSPDEISNIPVNNIFNIENATNSVIGTHNQVTLNINDTIQKTRKQINSSNSTDKEELQEIINLLEQVVNNQTPVRKGLLSKFSNVIQKNSWITSPMTSILLNWLMFH